MLTKSVIHPRDVKEGPRGPERASPWGVERPGNGTGVRETNPCHPPPGPQAARAAKLATGQGPKKRSSGTRDRLVSVFLRGLSVLGELPDHSSSSASAPLEGGKPWLVTARARSRDRRDPTTHTDPEKPLPLSLKGGGDKSPGPARLYIRYHCPLARSDVSISPLRRGLEWCFPEAQTTRRFRRDGPDNLPVGGRGSLCEPRSRVRGSSVAPLPGDRGSQANPCPPARNAKLRQESTLEFVVKVYV